MGLGIASAFKTIDGFNAKAKAHTIKNSFVINSDNIATTNKKLQKLETIHSHHKSDVLYLHHEGFIVLLLQ